MKEPSADSRFLFSGGDSMAAVELARRVEDRLDAQLPQLLDVVLNRTWAEVSYCLSQFFSSSAFCLSWNLVWNLLECFR